MLIVEMSYSNGWDLEKVSDDGKKAVWEVWPHIKLNHPKFEDWKPSRQTGKVTLGLPECYHLQTRGVELEIEGVEGTMLTKLQDKGPWGFRETVAPHQLHEGAAVQITIPDMALLNVDEVDWIDDACTQDLQKRLDDGWRILAVCPPNAKRRPDYILGRRKNLAER